MCWLSNNFKQKTIEEIVAENSVGMSDAQKAQYWYELSQSIFAILGKVDIEIIEIIPEQWIATATAQYPTLTDIKIADSRLFTTNFTDLQRVLTRDWTNLVPYVAEISDCDKYSTRLYSHLCDYYRINVVAPIWGDTDRGPHGYNLPVGFLNGQLIARLIEPQTDAIFITKGPLGTYVPRKTAEEFGIKKASLQ